MLLGLSTATERRGTRGLGGWRLNMYVFLCVAASPTTTNQLPKAGPARRREH